MRSMGGLPAERCRSEAFCSNIKLKKASIFAIYLMTIEQDSCPKRARGSRNDPEMSNMRQILMEEVSRKGPISFARFMELALYCPNSGYYEQLDASPGRQGDFYTSVSVGGLFGELLANQFTEWLA